MASETSVARSRRSVAWTMTAVLVAAPLGSVQAAPVVLYELSRAELAEMRGKFVNNKSVQYFGLSMNTQWQTPSFNHSVNMNMSMDLSGSVPDVNTSLSGTLGEVRDHVAETGQKVNQAVNQIQGAVQSIQVAGSNNTVDNKVAVNAGTSLASNNPVTSLTSDSAARSSSPGGDSQPLSVTQTPVTYQNNGVVTRVQGDGSFGYSVQAGGSLVVQQLAGFKGAGQLLQAVKLHGDAHHIANSIKLDVGFANSREMRVNAVHFRQNLIGLM